MACAAPICAATSTSSCSAGTAAATPQRLSTPCSASARASDPPTTATSSDNAADPGRPGASHRPPFDPLQSGPNTGLDSTRNQLKQILDEHFSFKTISINPEKGISAIDNDSEEAIPLSELSSGEQHELVLIYELLFKVEDGAVILIDEPELSLHVSWQKRFISDLQKIQNLKKMNVVIATHSPQVINDNWDLVQDLTSELTDD